MIGIVTGLASEAARARQVFRQYTETFEVRCAGADPLRAQACARELAAGGATLLISAGIAGALAPRLAAGTALLPEAVCGESGERFPTDAEARRAVLRALKGPAPKTGDLLGMERTVAHGEEKSRLHERTRALAIDLESLGVAHAAAENGLPFLVLRAIADPADFSFPPRVAAWVRPDGTTDVPKALLEAAIRPASWPRLIALGRYTGRALATLERLLGAAARSLS